MHQNLSEMEIFGKLGSFLQLNSGDDNSFLGSCIDVGEGNALTTKTDLEVASSNKVAPIKHKYCMISIKLFGIDLFLDNVVVAMTFFIICIWILLRQHSFLVFLYCHDLSNLCMSLLMILFPSLVIEEGYT
ncbi:hypothetical protein CR513_61196, partial [Mucuna pruriens]